MVGQARQAYTLLEMLLVVAIIAIVAGMAVPYMDGMYAGDRMTAAVDRFKSRLTEMQCRAKQDNKSYTMLITPGEDGFKFGLSQDCTGGPSNSEFPEERLQSDKSDLVFRGCTANDDEGQSNETVEIVILPDGNSPQNYEIAIGFANGEPMVVTVQGSSGALSSKRGAEGGR